MGKRHPNWRRIKIHRTYATEGLAAALDVHKNTVRNWMGAGLEKVDDRRPHLFRGAVVIDFLRARRKAAKRPLEAGQIYCLACRQPKSPAGNMAELTPFNSSTGNLLGICPDCDRLIYRRISMARIAQSCGSLEVSVRQASLHIEEGC